MDIGAVSQMLAASWGRGDAREAAGEAGPFGAGFRDGASWQAARFEASLARLKGLRRQTRRWLALYGPLTESVPAGLGADAAEAVLAAAGLERTIPEGWAQGLKLVRRRAGDSVRRDIPGGACIERTGFPVPAMRIEPMGRQAAARLWLERFR